MMAMPICEKQITYNTIRVLSIGRMMTSFQRTMNMLKNSTCTCAPLAPPGTALRSENLRRPRQQASCSLSVL